MAITDPICEVMEGFYETEIGKRWINLANIFYKGDFPLPVIPTDNTELLMPFYNKNIIISEGEDISAEEYSCGEYVCLISNKFAMENDLQYAWQS